MRKEEKNYRNRIRGKLLYWNNVNNLLFVIEVARYGYSDAQKYTKGWHSKIIFQGKYLVKDLTIESKSLHEK